jgi:hypothetical protein
MKKSVDCRRGITNSAYFAQGNMTSLGGYARAKNKCNVYTVSSHKPTNRSSSQVIFFQVLFKDI